MYGLDTEDIEAINKVFSKHSEIETAVLYGSRAKGNYRNDSDIDLTLKGEQITLSQLFEIETELDDLLLPYKIDLSIYHKIENPDFIEHIDRVGIIFYKNDTNKWEETTLDNHIDLISGYAFKSKDFLENQEEGTLPIIKIKNVANGDVNLKDVVYHNYDESFSKYKLSKGDVLIAMTGNHPQAKTQVVGDVSRYKLDVEALLNQRVGKIVPKGKTDLDFLYYFFKDKDTHRYLANQSSGSANQANISKANIIGMETEFPKSNEQKAIAKILKSIDDKIDLLHAQNDTLEAMSETLFRQWFIEEADEDWEVVKIGDYLEVLLGGTPSTKNKDYWNGEIPWINSGEINKYRILHPTKTITELGLKKSSTKLLPKGTTVIAITGATLGQVSRIEISTCANQSVIGIIGNNVFSNEFIFLWIKHSIKEIISNQTGGAQQHINRNDINNTNIVMPDAKTYELFTKTIVPKFEKITMNVFQINSLEKLRDSLLPKLMNGEIKVLEND